MYAIANFDTFRARSRQRNICFTMYRQRFATTMVDDTTPVESSICGSLLARVARLNAILTKKDRYEIRDSGTN